MTLDNKAQIQVTFHWTYILIAGAVILLFFVGIVFKQQQVSEERLSVNIVRTMESIFTGAGVSEKTKNIIDASTLASYTLQFNCEDGVGYYGIKDRPASSQAPIQPIFSPKELKTSKIVTWSLPYHLPYKVMDFLFVSSSNTQYLLLGQDSDFIEEFVGATEGFSVKVLAQDEYANFDPGNNFHIRIIDTSNSLTSLPIPQSLQQLPDDKVSAVSFTQSADLSLATYYQKQGSTWQQLNRDPIKIISVQDERDAAKYGAIFAGDDQQYLCNMQKAYKRLNLINEVHIGKFENLGLHYDAISPTTTTSRCREFLLEVEGNVGSSLETHATLVESCLEDESFCEEQLIISANNLADANHLLGSRQSCATLY